MLIQNPFPHQGGQVFVEDLAEAKGRGRSPDDDSVRVSW